MQIATSLFIGRSTSSGGRAFDADALAWQGAVVTAGGTLSLERLIAVDLLIYALKTGAVWANLDRLWLHAAENSQAALIDLVGRAQATPVNSPAFTVDRGYAGDGATARLDSGFNVATAGGKFALNDACMGTWVVAAGPGAGSGCEIGNNDSTYSWINAKYNTTNMRYAVTGNAAVTVTASGGAIAQWHAQRTSSTAVAVYRNGALLDSRSAALVSAFNNSTFGILAVASSGNATWNGFSSSQVAASYFGRSLGTAQISALYNALRAYMTTVGVP